MKTEWLEAVAAVARLRSFSEAAETIPCAQSSVSRYVRSAEDELGVTLFQRSSNSNRVELTEDGERLVPMLEKMLSVWDDITRSVPSGRQKPNSLRLGVDRWMYSSSNKGNLISLFYVTHPEVKLSIREVLLPRRMEALVSQSVDALLVPQPLWAGEKPAPPTDSERFRCALVGRQPISVAFRADRVAGRSSVSMAELADTVFFFQRSLEEILSDSSSRGNMFVQICRDSGFVPHIQAVDRELADVKHSLAAQGRGSFPSTIPPRLREYPGIRFLPVENEPYGTAYYLVSRSGDRNPAIPKLEQVLKNCFDE